MIKAQQYDWAKPGDFGKFQMIPLRDLKIDHSYQRNEVSDKNTLAIASNFGWDKFGTAIVMQRSNGDLYIVDGATRWRAAQRRGDIERIPCMVFQSDGKEHEARAFIGLNVLRKYVTASERYRAAVKANIEPESTIARWLNEHGLQVNESGSDPKTIDFVSALLNFWKKNKEASTEAIMIQREIIGDAEPMHSHIHKGIWYLLNRGVDVRVHIDKLKRTGKLSILGQIKDVSLSTGTGGRTSRVCAIGILSVINRRRHHKISLGEEE